jgi:hypothetical protein
MGHQSGTLSFEFLTTTGARRVDGTVLVVPSAPYLKDTTGHTILSGSVPVRIGKDAAGPVTIDLPATDDATLDPAGVTYTVIPPDGWGAKVTGVAVFADQTRHFADLMPMAPGPVSYLPDGITQAEFFSALTALSATYAGRDGAYVALAKHPDELVTGLVTLDGSDQVVSAVVKWPDASPGVLTITSRHATGAVLAYDITYGSPVTRTYSQPAITRNANGAATNVPAIVVT